MSRVGNRVGGEHVPFPGVLPRAASIWRLRSILLECVCAVLLSALVLMIFVQVIARYLLAYPLTWSQEIVSISFVWLCFLGAAVAAKYRGHIIVTSVIDLLPPALKRTAVALAGLAVTAFALLLVYSGYKMVLITHGQASSALDLPLSYIYAALPVGGALMAYYELKHVWAAWRGRATSVSLFKDRQEVNAQ